MIEVKVFSSLEKVSEYLNGLNARDMMLLGPVQVYEDGDFLVTAVPRRAPYEPKN